MKALALILSLAVAGCATQYVQDPSRTAAEFESDKYECWKVAEQRTANKGYAGNPLIERDYARECMTMEKGWVVK